jgi:hypothetical protein
MTVYDYEYLKEEMKEHELLEKTDPGRENNQVEEMSELHPRWMAM